MSGSTATTVPTAAPAALFSVRVNSDGVFAGNTGFAFANVLPVPEGDQSPSPSSLPARTCTRYVLPESRLAIVVPVPVPLKAWPVHCESLDGSALPLNQRTS